jgi:hypothetical protein
MVATPVSLALCFRSAEQGYESDGRVGGEPPLRGCRCSVSSAFACRCMIGKKAISLPLFSQAPIQSVAGG